MLVLQPLDFYILRCPILSTTKVLAINSLSKNSISVLNQVLKEIYQDKTLQEAIFLASQELYEQMEDWLSNETICSEKLLLSLYKYVLRSGFRCTPFGMFAGTSVGSINQGKTHVDISVSHYQRVSRIDMGLFAELIQKLLKATKLDHSLFYINSSLFEKAEVYRYNDYKVSNRKREYFLSEMEKSPYLDHIISAANNGVKFNELINLLLSDNISKEEAIEYIEELVENQILESDLIPQLTGNDLLQYLIDQIQKQDYPDTVLINQLYLIKNKLCNINHDDAIVSYLNVQRCLHDISPEIKSKNSIQTDLKIVLSTNNLCPDLPKRIINQVQELLPIIPDYEIKDMEGFKKRFIAKYEGQEISLLEALDSDIGIGYGITADLSNSYVPLIEDLNLPIASREQSTIWDSYQQLVLKLYLKSQREDLTVVEITQEDLQIGSKQRSAQFGLYLLGSLRAEANADIDQNFTFDLNSIGGSSALNLMGRFADNDLLAAKMKNYAVIEEAAEKDRIIAEVIHLPGDRIGNVMTRPSLYSYEIAYLGNTVTKGDQRIAANDLYIHVNNNRIVLRSKSLNKEVIPRLTTAHNFSNGLPVYKFLGDLQYQDHSLSFSWNWSFLEKESFLPRIIFKNLILQKSRWRITQSELSASVSAQQTNADSALLILVRSKKIPDMVTLVEGDNELFIDLTHLMARNILLLKLKTGDVLLQEYLASSFLSNGLEQYSNQIILPFINHTYSPVPVASEPIDYVYRKFIPGSQWLYLKVFTSQKWADKILINTIRPLVKQLNSEGAIDTFFFIRYNDPESHLRLRFKQTFGYSGLIDRVTSHIKDTLSPLLNSNIITKIQLDTYKPENEKYGFETIEFAESVFGNDSIAVLDSIAYWTEHDLSHLNWLFCLKLIDSTLEDFHVGLEARELLMKKLSLGFFNEFHGNKNLQEQLNLKYRKNTTVINTTILTPENTFPEEIMQILRIRSCKNKLLYDSLERGYIHKNQTQLVINIIHLIVNKIFPGQQRLMELTLYHFLMKFYSSTVAKRKKGLTNYI